MDIERHGELQAEFISWRLKSLAKEVTWQRGEKNRYLERSMVEIP